MKHTIAFIAVASLLGAPALADDAPNYNLSDYKTVAVQPVVAASNTPGLFENQMAAAAAQLEMTADGRAAGQQGAAKYLGGDGGFGFAGKAKAKDIVLFDVAAKIGMLPLAIRLDAAQAKNFAVGLEGRVAKLRGTVSDKVLAGLVVALQAAKTGDVKTTAQTVLVTMTVATEGISSAESARPHGYVAVGLYTGFATLLASAGQPNEDFALIAQPLIALLEEDAVMGGADRSMATKLRGVVGEFRKTPDVSNILNAIGAMSAIKPD